MNAMPTNPNPVAAVQGQSQAGKPADAATPDVPFKQVLSGQIARKADKAREETAADAPRQEAAPADASVVLALPGVEGAAPDAGLAPADAALAQLPDALLGLAITPDAAKLAPAAVQDAPHEAGLRLATTLEGRAGGVPMDAQLDPVPAANTGRAPVPDANTGRAAVPVAEMQAARDATPEWATAFTERLAAARQGDPAAASERVAELMSHPTMRAPAQAPVAATPELDPAGSRLAPSVGTTAWGQALGEKLVWMAAGNQQTASLTLNPPNLGPLQVVVNVTNDQATANFFSAQPEVRQALESAFPRLREMMNEAGIQLGQATVSADTPRQQNDAPEREGRRLAPEFMATAPAESAVPGGPSATVARQGRGLVDTFA